ncbi:MAG: DUF7674 family protein [Acidimicrobiales bacterium]
MTPARRLAGGDRDTRESDEMDTPPTDATPTDAMPTAHDLPQAQHAGDVGHASAVALTALLDALPEFGPVVAELAEIFDDGLSAHCVFAELAEITSMLLTDEPSDENEDRIERIFAAVELVATTPGADVVVAVAYSFLDGLDDGARARAQPYLGPATEHIAELLDDNFDIDEALGSDFPGGGEGGDDEGDSDEGGSDHEGGDPVEPT